MIALNYKKNVNEINNNNPLVNIPLVSVVLRSWNALEYFKLTYSTLYVNTQDVDYELIIVDDNSKPEVVSYLLQIDAKIVLNSRKVGVAETTRQGVQIARGKYVALIDNDVLLSQGWLSRLIEELEEHQAQLISPNRFRNLVHPDTGKPLKRYWYEVKTQKVDPWQAFLLFSGERDITEFSEAVLSVSPQQVKHLTCPPEFVGGSCIVYQREFIENIGGVVNKAFYPYGGEDVDLAWRIGKSGGKVLRSGKVHIHHFEHSSVLENKLDYEKSIRNNNQILFHHWSNEIVSFIRQKINIGDNISNLRDRYTLVDKYLAQYEHDF